MTGDNFIWLSSWYHKQCDGDWEHGNGIKIGAIDNPGWFLKVNLSGTELLEKRFQTVEITRSENDWTYCTIKDSTFEGFGGVFNLPELLQIFRSWAENAIES